MSPEPTGVHGLLKQRKLFTHKIHNKNLILTDIAEYAWVDRYMDALDIDCPDESVDAVSYTHLRAHET